MTTFRLLAVAFGLAASLPGQTERKPQLIWQGEVDNIALLYVHGKRLRVEPKDAVIPRQRFHIYDALPENRQDVKLSVSEGRGYVHIVEQPRVDNQFTLAISIEDRQAGSSFYSIALYWDPEALSDRKSGVDRITWSGRVEDEVTVACHMNHCVSEAVRGAPAMHEHVKISHPLPERDVRVALEKIEGRGEIRLLDQPSESNGHTARVRIRDPEGGAADYSFVLTWGRPGVAPIGSQTAEAQSGLVWSGRVEGTVRVTVHGGAAFSEATSGRPVMNETVRFDRPLPSSSDLSPTVKKRQGLGTVTLVESPTKDNGYHLVFEIHGAGVSELYEVEVSW